MKKIKNEFKKLLVGEKIFKTFEELVDYHYQLIDSETRKEEYFFRVNKTIFENNYFLEIYKVVLR